MRNDYRNVRTRAYVKNARKKRSDSMMKKNDIILKQSSSFIATNSELPIVDISAFDYDAYRFKLVETALRKQYNNYQPPGDVVMNSIHLNNNDSTIALRLNNQYHHSLFDFVEEYYDATKGMSKKETEYLHPLDHFLIKGTQKPETVEKETETKHVETADVGGQDERSPKISFYDDTVVDASMQRRQGNGELVAISNNFHRFEFKIEWIFLLFFFTILLLKFLKDRKKTCTFNKIKKQPIHLKIILAKKKKDPFGVTIKFFARIVDMGIVKGSLKPSKPRPSSAGADSTTSRISTLPRSTIKKSATKFSRTNSSTDSGSSKRETFFFNSHRREDKILSFIDGVERESMNCSTISSIDTESIRSMSSKYRDIHSSHSRDSSIGSRPCVSEKPHFVPWLAGNPETSFNKKYVNPDRISLKASETCKRKMSRKLSNSFKHRASKPSIQNNSGWMDQAVKSLPQLDKNSGKDGCKLGGVSKDEEARSSVQVGKLEVIKSETEKLAKIDLPSVGNLSARNDSLTRSRRSSIKNPSEGSSPRVQTMRKTIDSLMEMAGDSGEETRLAAQARSKRATSEDENAEEYSRRVLAGKQEQMAEKLGKVSSDRKQGSRNVSPVLLAKQQQGSAPKPELSMESFPTKDEIRENVQRQTGLDRLKSNEKRKDTSEMNVKTAKDGVKRCQDGQQARTGQNSPRSSAYERRSTADSLTRGKEEEKASEIGRRKTLSAIKNLGKGSANKMSFEKARSLHQRATSSKLNTDNLSSARSMQIGKSSRSPLMGGEMKCARVGKMEKVGFEPIQIQELKEGGPADDLKLPRRDSKAGIAMQAGLKKYIKKLKRVLSDRDNTNIGELASLSLTDAILPDLESTLSSVEVQEVQNLLNMAEKKSELLQKNISVL